MAVGTDGREGEDRGSVDETTAERAGEEVVAAEATTVGMAVAGEDTAAVEGTAVAAARGIRDRC